MNSTLQFLKIIGCITLLALGTFAFVKACFSGFGITDYLGVISEDLKDHCKHTVTWQD